MEEIKKNITSPADVINQVIARDRTKIEKDIDPVDAMRNAVACDINDLAFEMEKEIKK